MMGMSTSTSASSSVGAGGSGSGEPLEPPSGGRDCRIGRGSAEGMPWIGLGLLLTLRRRKRYSQAR